MKPAHSVSRKRKKKWIPRSKRRKKRKNVDVESSLRGTNNHPPTAIKMLEALEATNDRATHFTTAVPWYSVIKEYGILSQYHASGSRLDLSRFVRSKRKSLSGERERGGGAL